MVYIICIKYLLTMELIPRINENPRSCKGTNRPQRRGKILSTLLMIMIISTWVITIGVYAEDIGRSTDTAKIGLGVPISEVQNISETEAVLEAEPEYEFSNESSDIKSMEQAEEDRINSILIFGSTTLLILTPFIMQAGNHLNFTNRRKLTY